MNTLVSGNENFKWKWGRWVAVRVAASARHSEGETIKCIHVHTHQSSRSQSNFFHHGAEEKKLRQQTSEDLSKAWRILRLYSPPMCSAVSVVSRHRWGRCSARPALGSGGSWPAWRRCERLSGWTRCGPPSFWACRWFCRFREEPFWI